MKPNILFIMSDQMRYDSIGINGNKKIKTPHLDRLSKESIIFDNAYTPSPICVPARASLTTGFYPHKCTGKKDNDGIIKESFPLLGEELKKRDYKTYCVGKLHYLPYMSEREDRVTHGIDTVELYESGRMVKNDDLDLTKGLEDYYDYLKEVGWDGYTRGHGLGNNDVYAAVSSIPEEHYVDTWVTNRAIHYMDEHLEKNQDQPFFMWASFPKPHSAYDPPRPFDSLYDPREMDEPIGGIEELEGLGIDNSLKEYYKFMWDKLSMQAKKQIKAHYYGLITLQDKMIGKLLDYLDKKGIRDNTIIVYTADHGDMLGDKGLYFKRVFYEQSVKIPLIIHYPEKLKQSFRTDCLAGLQDILPTLCSLAGEPLTQDVDGRDLTPILTTNEKVRDYYVSQCNVSDPGEAANQIAMITDGRYKYIYTVLGGVEELYDLRQDPNEQNNCAKMNIDKKEELKKELLVWCTNNQDNDILDGKQFLKVCKKDFEMPKHINEFGRRFY